MSIHVVNVWHVVVVHLSTNSTYEGESGISSTHAHVTILLCRFFYGDLLCLCRCLFFSSSPTLSPIGKGKRKGSSTKSYFVQTLLVYRGQRAFNFALGGDLIAKNL